MDRFFSMKKFYIFLSLFSFIVLLLVFLKYGIQKDHATLSKVTNQVTIQNKIENISPANYSVGNKKELKMLEDALKQFHTFLPSSDKGLSDNAPIELSAQGLDRASVEVLFEKMLVKSNVDYFKNTPKIKEFEVFKSISTALALGSVKELTKEKFLFSLDDQNPFILKINDNRFSIAVRIGYSPSFFDIVKEEGVYKIDFLAPTVNCEKRGDFLYFVSRKENFKDHLTNDSRFICRDIDNASTTIRSNATKYGLAVDSGVPVVINHGGEKEFLLMYLLSIQISKDLENSFSQEQLTKGGISFVRDNFPDALLQKYFKNDYEYINNYEYSSKYVDGVYMDGKEIIIKPYRRIAIDHLLAIGADFVGTYSNKGDGLKNKNGEPVNQENAYFRLLTDKNGDVIYPSRNGDSTVSKIFFKQDGTLAKIDLLYYVDPDNCYLEGPTIHTLSGGGCGYSDYPGGHVKK